MAELPAEQPEGPKFTAADYTGPSDFVSLHSHSQHSVMDGVASIEGYADECKKRGWPAMAITEHGHMGSVPDMYAAFGKAKIKPIYGCELYFSDYEPERRAFHDAGGSMKALKAENEEKYYEFGRARHLTVLCKNQTGLTNLIKLTTQANKTGFYRYPRVWFDKLLEYKEGLIVLSGCLNGPISHELRKKDADGGWAPRLESPDRRGAVDWARRFKAAFGASCCSTARACQNSSQASR